MGIGIRVFIVEDDDRLRRISEKQFEGLRSNDKKTKPLPEYDDRNIRYVLVGLDIENRKGSEIIHIDYGYFCFDNNGRFDKDFRQREHRSVAHSVSLSSSPYKQNPKDNVIEAGHIFNKKRHKNEFHWTPTESLKKAIVDSVFAEKKPLKKPPLRLV